MSHRNILAEKSKINQFLFELGFFLHFCKLVLKHFEQFIKGSIQKGYIRNYNWYRPAKPCWLS